MKYEKTVKYKKVVARNGDLSAVVLLENGDYACVLMKRSPDPIMVSKLADSFYKWADFELCSDDDLLKEQLETIKYNMKHCERFILN